MRAIVLLVLVPWCFELTRFAIGWEPVTAIALATLCGVLASSSALKPEWRGVTLAVAVIVACAAWTLDEALDSATPTLIPVVTAMLVHHLAEILSGAPGLRRPGRSRAGGASG